METRIGMKEIKIIRRRMQENIEMNISTSRKMNQRQKDPRKQVFRDLLNTVKEHGSMTVIVHGRDGLDGDIQSVFSDKMEHMEKKTPGGKPYSQSSNPVVARSSRAGGAWNPMQHPETSEGLIQLLLTRLERISVDSYWAHRASGVRGALTKVLAQMEMGEPVDPAALRMNLQVGFEVLRKAAEEYL